MPHTRDLKPGFFRNVELAQLPAVTRLLYQGLWCVADKRGRLKDIPALIKSDVFPLENVPVEKHLKLLTEAGFIDRYESDGQRYIWVKTFLKHQHPHPKEPESVLPPSPADTDPVNVEAVTSPLPVHVEAGTRNGITGTHSVASASPLSSSPSMSSIPSVPSGSSVSSMPLRTRLNLSQGEIAQIREHFPKADINSRWSEWLSWIEEEEGVRFPKQKVAAFEGWLKKRSA